MTFTPASICELFCSRKRRHQGQARLQRAPLFAPPPQPKQTQVQQNKAGAKKKNGGLRAKAAAYTPKSRTDGGVDYVDLMMGGRRRARAEAAKMLVDDS